MTISTADIDDQSLLRRCVRQDLLKRVDIEHALAIASGALRVDGLGHRGVEFGQQIGLRLHPVEELDVGVVGPLEQRGLRRVRAWVAVGDVREILGQFGDFANPDGPDGKSVQVRI